MYFLLFVLQNVNILQLMQPGIYEIYCIKNKKVYIGPKAFLLVYESM